MAGPSFARALFGLSSLACAVLAANACSSDASDGDSGAADAAAPIEHDGAPPGADGAKPDDPDAAHAPDADASAANDGASDAAAPYRTVLGQQFNVNDVVTTAAGLTYVIGARSVSGVLRGVVVRLLANGTVDASFGTAGFSDVVLSATTGNQPLRGVLQANGQLVLVGVVYASPWDFVLTRLDTSGAIDTTFGSSGIARVHAGIGNDLPFAITAGPAGGFVFTGMAFGATNFTSEVVVGRVDSTGAFDTTFDGDGIAMTSIGGVNAGRGVALVSQDRVLVAAQSENAGEILLLRFTSGGALDPTFSTGQDAGATTLPAGSGVLRFPAVAHCAAAGLQKHSSGKWVVYGTGEVPGADAGTTRSTMMAARVDENGVVDATFHNGGGPFYPTPTGRSFGLSFASSPSGKSLVAGGVYEGPVAPFAADKYWPGVVVLDTSGNRDVTALGLFKGLYVPHAYPGNDALVAPAPNGRFVVVSSTATSVEVFELVP